MKLFLRIILFILIPTISFSDSESTIGGKTGTDHIIQVNGTSLRPRPYLNITGSGVTGSDTGGKTVVNISGSGGGASALIVQKDDVTVASSADTLDFDTDFDVTQSPSGEANVSLTSGSKPWVKTGTSILEATTTDSVGIGTSNTPLSKLDVYGGGIAGELVNKGYELIIPNPTGVNSTTAEVSSMCNFQGNMYIGYDSSGNTSASAPLYKWDGKTNSLFYTVGKGQDFQHINACEEYNNKLFIGTAGQFNGNGNVYVYDPSLTPSNFIQFPTAQNSSTNSITVPNDSSNNAIFGSTAYSVEYYGRIDDLGGLSTGQILRKYNSGNTSGFKMDILAGPFLRASLHADGSVKTTTGSTAFTLGAYHHFVMSWTSGSAPKLYIDGVESSYSATGSATTPTNDTGNTLYIGNSVSATLTFGGTFRRLRLWRNYALTASDVTSLYAGGSAASSPTGEYLFREGSGTTTADTSGNNNTGTLNGSVYWNTTLFDLSLANGTHQFMYALRKFKGNLYAASGFSSSVVAIYKFNGTTWSTAWTGAINGPSTHGLIWDMWVYKGRLFAIPGNTGGAIISTPDGVNWTTEYNDSVGNGFTRLREFRGRLYATRFSTTDQLYVRDDSNSTWSVVFSNPGYNTNQCDGLGVYNNALYMGCTNTTASGFPAFIFKSYDGYNLNLDLSLSVGSGSTIPTEVFSMNNYNGSLYMGLGFHTGNADIIRKTDSLGQLVDNNNSKFMNRVSFASNDTETIAISGPVSTDTLKVSTINNLTITQPVTGSTLTISNGKTFGVNNTVTIDTLTDGKVCTFSSSGSLISCTTTPTTGDVVGPASATDGVPALFSGITGKSIKNSTPTGTGNPVLDTSPTISAPTITGHPTIEGVTSTGSTGTGNMVFSAAPNLSGNITITTGGQITTNAGSMGFSQNVMLASSGSTSGNGITNTCNSLTSGAGLNTSSSSNNYTGTGLVRATYSGTNSGDAMLATITNASASGNALVVNNSGTGLAMKVTGHTSYAGTAPTIANNDCGTTAQGTVNTGSVDTKGAVTVGTLTVTSCSMTFSQTFASAPFCMVQDDTNILGIKATTSTTKLTITSTTSMSGDVINYICYQ